MFLIEGKLKLIPKKMNFMQTFDALETSKQKLIRIIIEDRNPENEIRKIKNELSLVMFMSSIVYTSDLNNLACFSLTTWEVSIQNNGITFS